MTIGIDIRVLGVRGRSGVQEYVENLLAHLLPLDKSVHYKLFYTSFKHPLRDYDWLHGQNVKVYRFKTPNQLLFYSSRVFDRPYVDQMIDGVDVFFSPHFLITALSPHVRRVTTFHDLSFEHFPEFFSWKQWLWHRFIQPARQARFSHRIISVSESTRQDLVSRYHIDPARITTIHSGIAPQFRPLPRSLIEDFRKRKQLPARYILFLGALEPRKNIQSLVRAFNFLKRLPGFEDIHLVLAGARGWLNKGVRGAINESQQAQNIHIREEILDYERPFYYGGAELFVYPSFFEGFGFPPLEAMACGTPVIASNTSSLPEVVGNAGILINPYHTDDLTLAISSVLTDRHLLDQLKNAGLEQIRRFTWQKCAQKTLEVLLRP